MLWAAKASNDIKSFILKTNCVEKNINIEQGLFFSFSKKNRLKKQKKLINISYLLMVLIKNRLLIFLVFSRYKLACKCGIIFQVHYIIGSRIAFFDAWHTNFESRKAIIKLYFLDKRCFSFFFFFWSWFCIKNQRQFVFVCSFLTWN